MAQERTSLNMELDDLSDFTTKSEKKPKVDVKKHIDVTSKFPSRESNVDGQLNMKGPQQVLQRFKSMCIADRRSYVGMLEILMDSFEQD
jgi:hypothetical protein